MDELSKTLLMYTTINAWKTHISGPGGNYCVCVCAWVGDVCYQMYVDNNDLYTGIKTGIRWSGKDRFRESILLASIL